MAEPYEPSLFVGREESLRKVLSWANDRNPTYRVFSIVGPPGIGKSYLLHRVRDQLREDPKRFVFRLNASRDPAIRQGPNVRTPEGLAAWLEDAVRQSREMCSEVRPFDPGISPEATIDSLVMDLCDKCPRIAMPILIVDSFDELEEQDVFEGHALVHFLGRSCTRILLGRRDEFGLTSPELRWNECIEQLPLMTASEGQEQVDRRIRLRQWVRHLQPVASPPPADLLDRLKALVLEYAWNHPGINTFLIERAIQRLQKGQIPLLMADDLRECIIEVTQSHKSLSADQLDLLARLASRLDAEWTELDLTSRFDMNLEDERLGDLFARGIIFSVEGTARYKVADGLRELLRAWQGKKKVAHPPVEPG